MKFTFPMAFSMTVLSWGVLQYWETYEAIGELENVLDQIRWGADWLINANPRINELYAVVGNPEVDHKYWGRAENNKDDRPAYKITRKAPGSDLAAEVAAAMSAMSLIFRRNDEPRRVSTTTF
jgi:endoglucanase